MHTLTDLFPITLPNGEPGTIFIKIWVLTVDDVPKVAYAGPFETVEDAQNTIDRLTTLNNTAEGSLVSVDEVNLTAIHFPIDRTFFNEPNITTALQKTLRQVDAALRTGDYEQWRDKPDEADQYMSNYHRSRLSEDERTRIDEWTAQRERRQTQHAADRLAADIATYRRIKALIDAGEIPDPDA